MRIYLTCLFGSLLAAPPLHSAAQPTDAGNSVRRIYVEGMPYEVAKAYSPAETPALLEMLQDEEEAPYWPNITMALGVIGDDQAVGPLIDFIHGRGSSAEWSNALYRARASAVGALGYLVNKSGNEEALEYLL